MFSISCTRTLPKTGYKPGSDSSCAAIIERCSGTPCWAYAGTATWQMPGDGLAPSPLSESKWGGHWPPPLPRRATPREAQSRQCLSTGGG
jgi:hypothetical protein